MSKNMFRKGYTKHIQVNMNNICDPSILPECMHRIPHVHLCLGSLPVGQHDTVITVQLINAGFCQLTLTS